MSEIKKKGALKDKNKKISTYKWWAFCHLATIFIKYTNHLGQSLLSKLGKSARPSLCLSLCCVFPLNSWDGSCQSAPICRTIHSVSFKNLWIFFFSCNDCLEKTKTSVPQATAIQFLSESHFNLKANAKGKSIHPIKAKLVLPAFPKLIHQHLYMFPAEFNQAVHDEPTRLLEYLWTRTMSAMSWLMRWFGAFTFFWILWHNDWWENMQGGRVISPECHYDARITNICAQGLTYSAIHMPIFCP